MRKITNFILTNFFVFYFSGLNFKDVYFSLITIIVITVIKILLHGGNNNGDFKFSYKKNFNCYWYFSTIKSYKNISLIPDSYYPKHFWWIIALSVFEFYFYRDPYWEDLDWLGKCEGSKSLAI